MIEIHGLERRVSTRPWQASQLYLYLKFSEMAVRWQSLRRHAHVFVEQGNSNSLDCLGEVQVGRPLLARQAIRAATLRWGVK